MGERLLRRGTAGHVSSETVKNYIQRHEEDES